jgi:hypothetical protein
MQSGLDLGSYGLFYGPPRPNRTGSWGVARERFGIAYCLHGRGYRVGD